MSDDTLVGALLRCQVKFPAIAKSHTNPAFKSKYADLADVMAALRPVLHEEGIVVMQPTRITDAGVELVTVLLRGTERIESAIPLQVDGKAQDLGSRLTYLRRYSICSLLGVVAEDDDDGNAASSEPRRVARRATPPNPKITAEQQKQVTDYFDAILDDEVRRVAKLAFARKFGKPEDILATFWDDVRAFIAEGQ